MTLTLQKIKKFFLHFFTLKDTPHNIAAGFALGIFLGIVPGEGVMTTLVLASLLKFNKSSALAGVLATNQWTLIFLMPISAATGGFLFGVTSSDLISQFNESYHLGLRFFLSKAIFFDLALPLIIGFVIIAGAVSLLSYLLLHLLLKYKKLS